MHSHTFNYKKIKRWGSYPEALTEVIRGNGKQIGACYCILNFCVSLWNLNGNARNLYLIYGFHPSFLEKLCPCHSSQGCMCKPYQQFSIFKCRNISYISAPRLVIPDNNFVSSKWKVTKIAPLPRLSCFFTGDSIFLGEQVPHQVPFCCIQCSEDFFVSGAAR